MFILSLFIGGVFDIFGGRLFGTIPFLAAIIGVLLVNHRLLISINNRHTKFNALVFGLIDNVEKGEPIPPLAELEKKTYFKNKL